MANVDMTQEEFQEAATAIATMYANQNGGVMPKKLIVSPSQLKAMSRTLGAGDTMSPIHTVKVDFDGDADNS